MPTKRVLNFTITPALLVHSKKLLCLAYISIFMVSYPSLIIRVILYLLCVEGVFDATTQRTTSHYF